jgi:hypothetical protein
MWSFISGGTAAVPSQTGKHSVAHVRYLKDRRKEIHGQTLSFLEPVRLINLRLSGRYLPGGQPDTPGTCLKFLRDSAKRRWDGAAQWYLCLDAVARRGLGTARLPYRPGGQDAAVEAKTGRPIDGASLQRRRVSLRSSLFLTRTMQGVAVPLHDRY